jgi:hypothetical protein
MDFVVRVVINKQTGEIAHFQVDAERDGRPAVEHDCQHEELATEIGQILDLFPGVEELAPGAARDQQTFTGTPEEPTTRTQARPETNQ